MSEPTWLETQPQRDYERIVQLQAEVARLQGEVERLTRKFLRGIRKLDDGCWTCDTAYATIRGYLAVQITEKGVQHAFKTHRFSYQHFVGPIPDGMHVLHKCDVTSCCNPEHLFLGTASDNVQDMVRKGRGLVGEKNANTKFTEADVLRIYADLDLGLSRKAIAAKFSVTPEPISHISTGRNWTHLYKRHRVRDPM